MNVLMQYLAGGVMLAIWAGLAYIGKTPVDPLIDLMKMALGGLVAHMLYNPGDPVVNSGTPKALPDLSSAQKGVILWNLMLWMALLVMGLSVLLAGCTTTGAAAVATFEASAKKGVQDHDDNMVQAIKDAICATPVGAVMRHTEMIPLVQQVCTPNGGL